MAGAAEESAEHRRRLEELVDVVAVEPVVVRPDGLGLPAVVAPRFGLQGFESVGQIRQRFPEGWSYLVRELAQADLGPLDLLLSLLGLGDVVQSRK